MYDVLDVQGVQSRRRVIVVRCIETGQVATVTQWAVAIAAKLGCSTRSVQNWFYTRSRRHPSNNMHGFGLHWAVDGPNQVACECAVCLAR